MIFNLVSLQLLYKLTLGFLVAPSNPVKFEPNTTFANASAIDEATEAAWAALSPSMIPDMGN